MANAKLYNNNKNIYKGSARVSYFTADLPIDEDLVDVENIAEIGGDTTCFSRGSFRYEFVI